MTLINEVKSLYEEAHKKWFERWYAKTELEKCIRVAAQEGYTAYLITVSDEEDKYLRVRLSNFETLSLLKEKLGDGFSVRFKEVNSKGFFNTDIHRRYIKISW